MKIKCTLEEYTKLIRRCQRTSIEKQCEGCFMENICGNDILEDAVEFEIVDAVNVEIEEVDLEDYEELDLEEIIIERS